MYDYPDELEIWGGVRINIDGSMEDRGPVYDLLALDRIVCGRNAFIFTTEATPEDIAAARDRLCSGFDRLVTL
jgi:hypothetical protein